MKPPSHLLGLAITLCSFPRRVCKSLTYPPPSFLSTPTPQPPHPKKKRQRNKNPHTMSSKRHSPFTVFPSPFLPPRKTRSPNKNPYSLSPTTAPQTQNPASCLHGTSPPSVSEAGGGGGINATLRPRTA
ncbi:hypothetical protein F4810DRAFT_72278 [Camillea tinctor]|nr:hypothetical protein F4810DRAFT_72278 [Camillea tinctor]